ncbi:hypothetical protein CORT_0E02550 [Candida orthopsilosis Co 90-125]|uniref:Uncharacterized protein n=1 Tax=Candida orthopsilosis (strain 90-125) TaxID=1136231 RepID=H8X7Q6_CANO9|nr:hypothetical protein CORT_0E02550 [Candida orthopsilosis Co 90-125]CCG23842.1 hypothetical protein CORT_0E02550 [Candida orthopsilosis Co 90-125]
MGISSIVSQYSEFYETTESYSVERATNTLPVLPSLSKAITSSSSSSETVSTSFIFSSTEKSASNTKELLLGAGHTLGSPTSINDYVTTARVSYLQTGLGSPSFNQGSSISVPSTVTSMSVGESSFYLVGVGETSLSIQVSGSSLTTIGESTLSSIVKPLTTTLISKATENAAKPEIPAANSISVFGSVSTASIQPSASKKQNLHETVESSNVAIEILYSNSSQNGINMSETVSTTKLSTGFHSQSPSLVEGNSSNEVSYSLAPHSSTDYEEVRVSEAGYVSTQGEATEGETASTTDRTCTKTSVDEVMSPSPDKFQPMIKSSQPSESSSAKLQPPEDELVSDDIKNPLSSPLPLVGTEIITAFLFSSSSITPYSTRSPTLVGFEYINESNHLVPSFIALLLLFV